MRIVIVGLGQTGQELAKEFIFAGHEIIVIDTNKDIIENFTNHYDALGVVGSGASKEVQLKAKVSNADVLIALSPTDEVNLMSCITAKVLGTKYTIARVTAPEYVNDELYLTKDLGVDLIINPEYEVAKEITRIVGYPSSVKVDPFANGKVDIALMKVKEGSSLLGFKLCDLRKKFKEDLVVVAIVRDEKLIIPKGEVDLRLDDEVFVITKSYEMYNFLKSLELVEKPVKSAFVVGAGKIGGYLFKNFERMKLKVKVVENDKDRCVETVEKFPNITVIHGNGVDSDMLMEEGVEGHDCCIAITGEDEVNIVVTLFSWAHKVRKLVTKVSSVSYSKMLNNVEINDILSPHLMVLSSVHRFIRGISGKEVHEENINSIYRFASNMAEAIEFEVPSEFSESGKRLKDVRLRKDVLIAVVIRNGEVIVPNGETCFKESDRVIVVVPAEMNLGSLKGIFEV